MYMSSENQQTSYDDKIQIIMNQTSLTKEQCEEHMKKHNNDYIKVIEDYMKVPPKPKPKDLTTNQEIYKQIRDFMDVGSNNFYGTK